MVRYFISSLRQRLISSLRFQLPRPDAAAVRRFLADPWLWAVLGVTAVGAFLRLYRLTDIPPGVHGDEAWAGIQANRILDEGWIGAYITLGFGNNAGAVYWVAPFVGLLGDTVLAIRLPIALMGIATIPVAYLAFAEMAGKRAGLIGAFLLAVSTWHIHMSRIAFVLTSWPLMQMAVLWALFWAFRTKHVAHFVLAGLLLGLGVHTYNAYPLFVVGLGLFLVWAFIRGQPMPRPELLRKVALMTIAAFIVALPLILEAADSSSLFRNDDVRTNQLIFNSPAYETETFFDRVDVVASRAWEYFLSLTWEANFDAADGLGLTPILDRFTIVLALAGLAYMAFKWRRPSHVLVWLMILLIPLAAVLTVQGMHRRTLGLVPFVSLAAALPLALAWEQALKLKSLGRWALLGVVVLLVGLIAQVNLVRYFDTFANSQEASGVFAEDLTKASEYVADLPGRPYIYLYSGRFLFAYETQRYLLPDRPGEDRSREHGEFSLETDRNKDVVFVFLSPYLDLLPQVEALHPGGIPHEGDDFDGQPVFRAYYLPRQAETSSSADRYLERDPLGTARLTAR